MPGRAYYLRPGNKKFMATKKKAVKKKTALKKNKLGVQNSLVNNINARKKKGISRPKKKSAVSKSSYNKMENNWGKKEK
jgi:hypothetical protein